MFFITVPLWIVIYFGRLGWVSPICNPNIACKYLMNGVVANRRGECLVYTYKMGQMVSILIHLGDRLDLFKSMAALDRFVTTKELADHTGYVTSPGQCSTIHAP